MPLNKQTVRVVAAAIVLFAVALGGALATPASADHTRLSSLDSRIAQAREREAALDGEIGSLTTQVRELEAKVGAVSTRLGSVEHDLELHRSRLAAALAGRHAG